MPPAPVPAEWQFPRLRASFGFEDDGHISAKDADGSPDTEFFDVKFYPYGSVDAPPVFAATSKKHIVVCRLSQVKTKDVNPCDIVQVIRDADIDVLNCCCTWSRDPETFAALLCVSGRDGKVKVYDVNGGKAVTTLVGHGGEINDVATSPANPTIIASASDDTTVRIWSLDPVHKEQPCVCLFGGEGHAWNLLSVSFHDTGRYVLSAGHDQVTCMWTVPDIPKEHMDVPIVVHYPHFSTSEVHTGLIDCVSFYGDNILSRACHEDIIVFWRIEGFSSSNPPPSQDSAPSAYETTKLTRSAFAPASSGQAQYTRLLQFHTSGCGNQFFMRFGVFSAPGQHAILAFCNAGSKIYFWDFSRFAAYSDYMAALRAGKKPQQPAWLVALPRRAPKEKLTFTVNGKEHNPVTGRGSSTRGLGREPSDRDSLSRHGSVASNIVPNAASKSTPGVADGEEAAAAAPVDLALAMFGEDTMKDWEEKYAMRTPDAMIKPHRVEAIKGGTIVGRQVAWSPRGDWCVVVGSNNRAIILHRWAEGAPGAVDEPALNGHAVENAAEGSTGAPNGTAEPRESNCRGM